LKTKILSFYQALNFSLGSNEQPIYYYLQYSSYDKQRDISFHEASYALQIKENIFFIRMTIIKHHVQIEMSF